MISHFAAISPQVDINALVMDSTVKAPEVTCCITAINITSYVYAHCDFNEAALMVGSVYFCANTQQSWCDAVCHFYCQVVTLSAESTPQVLRITAGTLIILTHFSAHTLTFMGTHRQTLANNGIYIQSRHTQTSRICVVLHFCSVESVRVTTLQML